MKIRAGVTSFFYAVVLSLWIVSLPQLKYYLEYGNETALEQSNEKVASIDQGDLFLVKQNNSTSLGTLRGDFPPNLNHFVNEHFFNHLYLCSLFSTVFSHLETVDLSFEFIDLIFPFHYFW